LSNSSDASATIVVVQLASASAMVAAVASGAQPTRSEAPLARFDVDIGDRDHVDTGDVARLGEVHGAVAAGTNEADTNEPTTLFFVLLEQGVQVHELACR
jgi:hypothetical protein